MTIILDIVTSIAEDSSLKAKQSIMEQHKDNEVLKKCFFYAENPRFNFYIKADPEMAVGSSGTEDISLETFNQLDQIINRKVTGNDARLFLQSILLPLNTAGRTIVIRIVNRDLRCNAGTSIANKVWKNLIPEYPVMLASKGDKKAFDYLESLVDKDNFVVQCKCDGGRINVMVDERGNVTYRSRNGSELNLHGFFDSQFQEYRGMVFDGELLVRDKDNGIVDRKISNGLYTKSVRGTITKEEISKMCIVLWDVVPIEEFNAGQGSMSYRDRLRILVQDSSTFNPSLVSIVESKIVHTIKEVQEFYELMRSRGEEGAIVKVASSRWEDRRSKNMVKMKAEESCDALVVGYEDGTGKYSGMIGSLICESSCGKLRFNVGSGFTEADRKVDPQYYLGKIVEVVYNEVISSKGKDTKSLFLPIFKTVRDDKTVANRLEELK